MYIVNDIHFGLGGTRLHIIIIVGEIFDYLSFDLSGDCFIFGIANCLNMVSCFQDGRLPEF